MISEVINHLWQSTFFALGVALLAPAFRKNRAQVRYWLVADRIAQISRSLRAVLELVGRIRGNHLAG